MILIPDEAILAMSTISGSAFKLYAYLCAGRNKRSGTSYPSQKRIAKDIGCGYTHVSRLKAELINSGWIEVVKGNEIRPLKGFPKAQDSAPTKVPKSASSEPGESAAAGLTTESVESSQKRKTEVPENATSRYRHIPKSATRVPKSAREVPKNATKVPKSANAYKEEPLHEPLHLTSTLELSTAFDETSPSEAPSKPARKNPAVEPWYGLFQQAYAEAIGGFPYEGRTHDFVQLRAMLGKPSVATWLTAEKWSVGLRHYFESELGSHTLADFATRFGDFYKNALDRFGKPVRLARSQPETLRPLYVPDEPIADDDPNYVTVKEALSGSYKRPSTSAK